ncbi:hypothetical protein CR513_50386, partial [Mucuna pruriens]
MEDQTIEDIDKVKKTTLEKDNSLSEIDLVRMLVHDLNIVENNVQNGEQYNYVGDQHLGECFDVPPDDDAKEEQEMSQDERRYTSNEHVTLIDGEESKCYEEAMESEERQKWLDAMLDEIKN